MYKYTIYTVLMFLTTGPHNVSVVNGFIVGTCGTPLRGSQSIIEAPDETGEGEVWLHNDID